jgi:hypothetical protein
MFVTRIPAVAPAAQRVCSRDVRVRLLGLVQLAIISTCHIPAAQHMKAAVHVKSTSLHRKDQAQMSLLGARCALRRRRVGDPVRTSDVASAFC